MPKNELLRDSKKILTWLFPNGVGLDNPRTPRDSSNICSMILFILLVSSSDVNFQLFQRSNTSYERQWTDPSELSNYPQSVRRDLILTWSNENGRIMTLFLSFCFFVLFLFFLTKFSRIPSWKSWIRGKGQSQDRQWPRVTVQVRLIPRSIFWVGIFGIFVYLSCWSNRNYYFPTDIYILFLSKLNVWKILCSLHTIELRRVFILCRCKYRQSQKQTLAHIWWNF